MIYYLFSISNLEFLKMEGKSKVLSHIGCRIEPTIPPSFRRVIIIADQVRTCQEVFLYKDGGGVPVSFHAESDRRDQIAGATFSVGKNFGWRGWT